jgi:L-alanine-DL-glutamate epimerase-like enolase superfamily enzyme
MTPLSFAGLTLRTGVERWPLKTPFRISSHVFDAVELAVVELEQDGIIGRGEAAGLYYFDETASTVVQRVESYRDCLTTKLDRERLMQLLPAGSARNAIDCALWDLEAKMSGVPAWRRAGLPEPKPLVTTFTCGADTPDKMVAAARRFGPVQALKLKLTADGLDVERVAAIRAAFPDCWLGVDANQGMTSKSLLRALPAFEQAKVALIEQPLPVDSDAELDGIRSPIPIAADESAQTEDDLGRLMGRVDVINIKLDKCGGLTAGSRMAAEAKRRGFRVMVGNMMGTSLAMAPAFLLGQECDIVDLDGPALLTEDREPATIYVNGLVSPPTGWGLPLHSQN